MFKNIFILLFTCAIILAAVFASAIYYSNSGSNPKHNYFSSRAPDKNSTPGFHYSSSANKEFYGDLEDTVLKQKVEEKVFGGILSHHLFAAAEISQYFSDLRGQPPKTVVLIGPDHFGAGSGISISKYDYQTPWGILESDEKNIQELIDGEIADNDEKPFEMEHSISALVSYIKYFFPKTKFIPIILKRSISSKKLDNLAQALNNNLPEDSLVLASVDFSHHLSAVASEFHDKTSIAAITNFDYERIPELEIDSPPSIYVLLKYLEGKGAKKIQYKNISSSSISGNAESEDVTSYLFAYFTKGISKYDDSISILNFGDAMFDRVVKEKIQTGKDPFEYIKGPEGNFLKGVDFIALNLEGPITESKNCQKKSFSFRFDPSVAVMLAQNNIGLLNLANNHSFDCYEQGFNDTKKHLDARGIGHFGGGRSLENSFIIRTIGKKQVAFIGIDHTLGMINIKNFYPLIKELKQNNDYVVVNIHWGNEYNKLPSQAQKDVAHELIDSGADVIFGHHPHVTEPVEIYKNKPIFYSLGNFIFDQIGKETNEGVGIGAVLGENNQNYYVFPYRITNTQPKLFSGKEMLGFCDVFLNEINNRKGCIFSL